MAHRSCAQHPASYRLNYDPTLRRKTPLAHILGDRIRRQGPIRIDDYMSACLWDPQYGYYATRQPLGAAGDFVTAPEISQIFGELIGLWATVVWRDWLGRPQPFTLAELGPGRGTLMRDMLRATATIPGFHANLHCQLVEASTPLIAAQKSTLSQCGVPMSWGPNMSGARAPAIVIANEFFDAMPLDQWVKSERGWARRSVELDDNCELQFATHPTTSMRPDLDQRFPDAAIGAISESQRPEVILGDIGALNHVGPVVALIIDYGHEKTTSNDTLQAVRQHQHEHPLTSPGEADLSAQVDFEELAAEARKVGLVADGPITQAEFLGRLGIIERASQLMAANPQKAASIETDVARLLAPNGMGTRFKVLALRTPSLPSLPGFDVPRQDITK